MPLDAVDGGYEVTIGPDVCSGVGWLFGGWGLGLAVDAVRTATGRPVRDLSLSFVRPIASGARLTLSYKGLAAGRNLGHGGITVHDDDAVALSGLAVVGTPSGDLVVRDTPPPAPPPEFCPERPYAAGPGTGTSVLLDVRSAGEESDVGVHSRILLWARLRCEVPDEVRLAVVSDHVPFLLKRVFPDITRFSTVNSSLRLLGGPVAEWVLLDVTLVALAGRLATGRVALWSDGTTLVGVAEQSTWLSGGSASRPG